MNNQITPIASLSMSDLAAVEARLRKKSCHDEPSYLNGSEEDRLLEWYNKDMTTLDGLGVNQTQIADRLDALIARAHEVWRQSVDYQGCDVYGCEKAGAIIDRKFHVIAHPAHLCYTQCPFPGSMLNMAHPCFGSPSQDHTIINIETGEKIHLNSIFSHLVRDHGFFGGNTELRISPEKLVRVLDLKTGQGYKLQTITKLFWIYRCGSFPTFKSKDLQAARINAMATYSISEFTEGYLLKYKDWFTYKDRDLTYREWDIKTSGRDGLSDEVVADKNKYYEEVGIDPDAKMWVDRGIKYLHLFTHQDTKLDNNRFILEGGELVVRNPLYTGYNVYELSERSIPALGSDDSLNVERYQEWKKSDDLCVTNLNQCIWFMGRIRGRL